MELAFSPVAAVRSLEAVPGPEQDRILVTQTLEGDLGAYEELVGRHHAVVTRIAARVVGHDEAEDVSQDAFLRAFHRLDGFRGESSVRTWLLRIAHNAALDHLRRRRAEPVDPASLDETPADESVRLPAERLELRERVERLEGKLQPLSPPHRTVLVLRDVEGLSYDEVAAITETPLGSVKGRLHRARRELIGLLRANTYDWELPDE